MRIKKGINYYERRDVIEKYEYSQTTFDKKSKLGIRKVSKSNIKPIQRGVVYPPRLN